MEAYLSSPFFIYSVAVPNLEARLAVIERFNLRNFKGAAEVSIEMSGRVDCPVTTLIGLNESGKTTILEGLSHFATGDNSVSSLFEGVHSKAEVAALVPIHRKAAFSDSVSIEAVVRLDDTDCESLRSVADDLKFNIDLASFPREIGVTTEIDFEDSVESKRSTLWELQFSASKRTSKARTKLLDGPDGDPDLWTAVVRHLAQRVPRVAYFPTFLVDMPVRIYLQQQADEKPVNRYYRSVFQDILTSLGEGLDLEKHVCKRIEDFRIKDAHASWISRLLGGPTKGPIDSVFQKVSSAVTREVLGSWRKVFDLPVGAKSVSVEWNIDADRNNTPYATFYVSDGESKYSIAERSLGFRWFFSFLLFTAFKRTSMQPTLFVFDEPAANLHAKAQAELLKSFDRIVEAGNRIVYSTHSHHMINPRWLSGAYIVENTALDYDSSDSFDFGSKPTNIRATRYREFVSSFPSRVSYFQPVIEKLQYVEPEIVGRPPYVVVEGISDYYFLKSVQRLRQNTQKFSLVPGTGANASSGLISLLLGQGSEFVVLLDDDKTGRKAAETISSTWYLKPGTTLTLANLNPEWTGLCIEGLLCAETVEKIKAHFSTDMKPTKKQVGLYFAEVLALKPDPSVIGLATRANAEAVLDALESATT